MKADQITIRLEADPSGWQRGLAWASRSLAARSFANVAREVEDITQRIEHAFSDPGPALDRLRELAATTPLTLTQAAEQVIREAWANQPTPKRQPSGLHVTRAQIDNAPRKANR